MSYNGSGTFVINTAGQPVVSGTVISSTAFNALTADLATGLSTAITKDGQTTPTANIPMGNNKITGLAVGTAATDAANLSQVQSTAAKLVGSVSGVDTITGTMSPTLAAYAAGQMFYFVAAGDNTGAVTLNLDGLGAKSVTRDGSVALAAGDIKSGEVVVVVYDGTRFQVVSQLNSAGNATFANVSITSALNVGGVATFTGNPVLSGGTANGVLYLNASKVATSGSALTFNGTALAVTGTANSVDINPTTGNPNIPLRENNVFRGYIEANSGGLLFGVGASATEGMRLTSTGLGIGTSSPAARLHVVGGTAASLNAPAIFVQNNRFLTFQNAAGTGWAAGIFADSSDNATINAIGYLSFGTGGSATERARVTSGGNFGINTTDPQGRLSIKGGTNNTVIEFENGGASKAFMRSYDRTANAYKEFEFLSEYLIFSTGSSPSERARITSGGDFGIGTTSPGARLGVITGSSPNIAALYVGFGGSENYYDANTHIFRNGSQTERARITSGGNFLINNTSATDSKLIVTGGGTTSASYSCIFEDSNGDDLFWARNDGLINTGTKASSPYYYVVGGTNRDLYIDNSGAIGITTSVRASKTNIAPVVDTDWLLQLNPVTFHFRKKDADGNYTDEVDGPLKHGLIAEEVEEVNADLCFYDDENKGGALRGVNYSHLVTPMLKLIQKQQAAIAALEAKVAALEAK